MTPKQIAIDLFNGNCFDYVAQRQSIRRLPEGRVIETPTCCLWGFPVRYDPAATHYPIQPEPHPDAWLVWLCTGTIEGILDLIPYPLPYIIFARDNRLRTYKFQTITSKIMKWHSQLEQQHQFGGGAPGPTKTQKENDRLNNALLKQQLNQKPEELPPPPAFAMPAAPKYAPPPSQTSQDTESAAREVARANRRRRGFAASRLGAGNTGASRPSSSAPSQGTKTTLG